MFTVLALYASIHIFAGVKLKSKPRKLESYFILTFNWSPHDSFIALFTSQYYVSFTKEQR